MGTKACHSFVYACAMPSHPPPLPPSVVIWNLETREALCGSPAATQSVGQVYCLAFANSRDDLFVTGGK